MIDSHAHYTYNKFDGNFSFLTYSGGKFSVLTGDRSAVLDHIKSAGTTAFIEPAIDIDSNYKILKAYRHYKGFLFPAVGVHPTRTFLTKYKRRKELAALAQTDGVVAIGETGLDYHYARKDQHRLCQKRWFRYQLKIAERDRLPLVLHIRKADKDALRILKRFGGRTLGGVAHCFNGDALTAMRYVELGFCLGIGGMILGDDARAEGLIDAVKILPVKSILLETDAPYVLPCVTDGNGESLSKKIRNTSSVIYAVAEKIAEIKGMSAEEVIRASDENVKRVFGITVGR